ncbi:hypothetical protein [Stackebrandtia nassauensis]|uniref:Uncharacterized protein n=1 Tax=Stackebrandtia nassauensis (strain DSM 44728 / CIP 108903 / NRRL B-16338 / NBRC 102104 / LLR-40K-21) TaxID=446470 RepID=D3Q477_STANL|nr:hypothetical protein [Stackebrandtia nassauensis]ADD45962.1 hypothetical protein Snas_6345 [Stackebrandtia nassauensis DSM 44728]
MTLRRSLVAAALALAGLLTVSAPAIASLSDSGTTMADNCHCRKCC